MHVKFIRHDTSKSISSSNTMLYLDKENQFEKVKNQHLILDGREDEIEPYSVENFFNQNFNPYDLNDPNSNIDIYNASMNIDKNRGTQKLDASNFFMLNISPSQNELEHMETIAIDELNNRGLFFEDVKDNETGLKFYNEQKDQLMKLQMKLFVSDVMEQYALQMDREIYADQNNLPSNNERKKMQPEIDKLYSDFLIEKGLENPSLVPNMISVQQFKVANELEQGTIFKIYSEEINKNVSLFVPNNKFTLEDDKLNIEEEYYINKYDSIIEAEKEKFLQVEINSTYSQRSNENYTDFVLENKIEISHQWDAFDKEIKLHFSSGEFITENGIAKVSKTTYENALHNAKSKFLSNEFKQVREGIYNKLVDKEKFDLTKIVNSKGKEVFKNPKNAPNKEDLKRLEILTSVEFNKYLESEGYLEAREKTEITDWDNRTFITAEIQAESEKAKLLLVKDARLDEDKQFWMPNFALIDKETGEVEKDENGKISIISEFYNNKINEILALEKDEKIEFQEYREYEKLEEKNIKNSAGMEFTFTDTGLKEDLKINVQLTDLHTNSNGDFTIEKRLLEHKFQMNLIKQAKIEFSEEYKKIKEAVNVEKLEAKDFVKNQEIERQFKNFLVSKDILKQDLKNDNYTINASIVEKKNNSTLIEYKADNEEKIRLWVNNKSISSSTKETISFRDEKQITELLQKAIDRDKEQKKVVEISFDTVNSKDIKGKEENEKDKLLTFYKTEKGLTEPIAFSFKESEIKKEGDKYFVEKFKLDFRTKKAKENGINIEFGDIKEDLKHRVWKENGFSTEKRKITAKDLLYYGKVETSRTYKHTDKSVIKNKPILTEIKKLKLENNSSSKKKIAILENELLRDKFTNEIIDEGVKKGGLNYHSHIVISRHDQTSINPRDKVSMSPDANHREGKTNNGAKVGFNRDQFSENVQNIFDKKFEYNRPEKEQYSYLKLKKNLGKEAQNKAKNLVKGRIKQEIMKHTGMNIIKNELSPTQKIKQELMPLPIPTSFPKSKLDLVVKLVKMAKNLVVDKGMQY